MLEDKEFQPCIVYIPNCQELILESKTQYKHFKLLFKQLEGKTKGGSVIISCIENSETTGESGGKGKFPQSMMISSKSSTTLLDFSLFDHFSKNEGEKGSYNKNYKLLKKIMPTTININPPSKPSLLNEWRLQIERDVKSIKKQNNISLITKLMSSSHLSCAFDKISSSYLENHTLSTTDAHKIIGWALSHHIMNQHNSSSLLPLLTLNKNQNENNNNNNNNNNDNNNNSNNNNNDNSSNSNNNNNDISSNNDNNNNDNSSNNDIKNNNNNDNNNLNSISGKNLQSKSNLTTPPSTDSQNKDLKTQKNTSENNEDMQDEPKDSLSKINEELKGKNKIKLKTKNKKIKKKKKFE